MCPQVGDSFFPNDLSYGVPGPSQTTCVPSPMSQVTNFGRAVAVTCTPSTSSVTVYGPQASGSPVLPTHIHAGRPTAPTPRSSAPFGVMPISMP